MDDKEISNGEQGPGDILLLEGSVSRSSDATASIIEQERKLIEQ